jgi:hypothetical protein
VPGLILLLDFVDFLFHFLDLLFQFILFPDLPFDLFTVLGLEQFLSACEVFLLNFEPSLEFFLVHDVILVFEFLNLFSLLFQTHPLVFDVLHEFLLFFYLLGFVLDEFMGGANEALG